MVTQYGLILTLQIFPEINILQHGLPLCNGCQGGRIAYLSQGGQWIFRQLLPAEDELLAGDRDPGEVRHLVRELPHGGLHR